jgi:hypothetical protein
MRGKLECQRQVRGGEVQEIRHPGFQPYKGGQPWKCLDLPSCHLSYFMAETNLQHLLVF